MMIVSIGTAAAETDDLTALSFNTSTLESEEHYEVQIFNQKLNMPGDQYINFSIGTSFPLSYSFSPYNMYSCFDFDGDDEGKIKIGGIGSLGYHYFLTSEIAVGGEVAFGYHVTIGSNNFSYIPVIATITYQPSIGNFEFPLTLGVGFAWETYSNHTYWPGLVVRPEAGVQYRVDSSWSIGLDVSYYFLPEFMSLHDSSAQNVYAQFLATGIYARYFF